MENMFALTNDHLDGYFKRRPATKWAHLWIDRCWLGTGSLSSSLVQTFSSSLSRSSSFFSSRFLSCLGPHAALPSLRGFSSSRHKSLVSLAEMKERHNGPSIRHSAFFLFAACVSVWLAHDVFDALAPSAGLECALSTPSTRPFCSQATKQSHRHWLDEPFLPFTPFSHCPLYRLEISKYF